MAKSYGGKNPSEGQYRHGSGRACASTTGMLLAIPLLPVAAAIKAWRR